MYVFLWSSHQLLGLWKYYYKRKVDFRSLSKRYILASVLEVQHVSVCVQCWLGGRRRNDFAAQTSCTGSSEWIAKSLQEKLEVYTFLWFLGHQREEGNRAGHGVSRHSCTYRGDHTLHHPEAPNPPRTPTPGNPFIWQWWGIQSLPKTALL